MSNLFSTFCDDFYVNMRLGSQIGLPTQRETVLHLFERVQKEFPEICRFRKTEGGDFTIEEDCSSHSYRWASLEPRRIASGHVNPASLNESLRLHRLMLQLAPFHLGVSPLEVEYLDVLFGFDLSYAGNHDELIAETLLADSPLSALLEEDSARAVDVQPSVTIALSDDHRLQARLDVVTRTRNPGSRVAESGDDVISVYLVLRRSWDDQPAESFEQVLEMLTHRGEQLCLKHVLPRILKPLSSAIASRS